MISQIFAGLHKQKVIESFPHGEELKFEAYKKTIFSALYEELLPTSPPYTEATFVETGTDCFTEQACRL